jgi:hypothetical protein
VVEW